MRRKKKHQKKALAEREPEVREYFKVVNDLLTEYMDLADVFIENSEKISSGKLNTMEMVVLYAEMGQSAIRIQELYTEIEELDEKKSDIEEKLTAEDVQEFVTLYAETTKRAFELAEEIEGVDMKEMLNLSTSLF